MEASCFLVTTARGKVLSVFIKFLSFKKDGIHRLFFYLFISVPYRTGYLRLSEPQSFER